MPSAEPEWGEPEWSRRADRQYRFWQQHEPRVADKIDELVKAVMADPFSGIGKPKYLNGFWSRRITEEHRLAYTVEAGRVFILPWSQSGGIVIPMMRPALRGFQT